MKKMLIILTVLLIILVINYESKPGNFKIINFNQDISNLDKLNYLTWSKSKNADKYIITVYDNSEKVIQMFETTNTEVLINDLNVNQNSEIKFEIKAINKNGQYRVITTNSYLWKLPSIVIEDNNFYIKENELLENINVKVRYDNFKDIYLKLEKEDKTLNLVKITDNNINLDIYFNNLENKYGTYKILLIQNDVVLNERYIYIKPPKITEIKLIKPYDNAVIPYMDFELIFSGGLYADHFLISVYDENSNLIVENQKIDNFGYYLSKDILKPNSKYRLKLTAFNYLQSSVLHEQMFTIYTASENKVSDIVATRLSGEIGYNRPIRLTTFTNEATIHYTNDGENPTCNSKLYKGNIYIDKDMKIKAVACSKNSMMSSNVIELDYKAITKPKAIYLSPSNQINNIGVSSSGFTNEMEIMNRITDYIEVKLKENNILVYRNNSNMNLNEIVMDSSNYDIDFHLAIHSNLYDGKVRGVETWVQSEEWKTPLKLANIIQNDLISIYSNPNYNRGVKYSKNVGGLRETDPINVTNGILVEVAFHDQYDDAIWIMNNIELIGNTIANSVLKYYESKEL